MTHQQTQTQADPKVEWTEDDAIEAMKEEGCAFFEVGLLRT